LNLNELKELLELVLEKGITEFELEEKGVRLRIKKGLEPPAPVELVEAKPSSPIAAPLVPAPNPPGESLEEAGLTLVRSPMVGTFYRSPEPSAPPFVQEGDRIRAGQVLCIIEAMKLMNEIESEAAGEIVRVLVENGQPVQYGDELFALRVSP